MFLAHLALTTGPDGWLRGADRFVERAHVAFALIVEQALTHVHRAGDVVSRVVNRADQSVLGQYGFHSP